jgi:lambda family phage portal protein
MAKKKRKNQGSVRRYDGARRDRLTSDWATSSTSADSEIFSALRLLRDRSRDLVQNNPYLKSAIYKTIPNNVVGQGLSFQSQVRRKRIDKLDDSVNTQIEEAWKEWQEEPKWCHTAGKLSLSEIERLVIKSLVESGEVLIRKVSQAFDDSPVPFALEVIEADQLCETHAYNSYQGNQVKMGVELNEWQRPIAYHLYPYHPGDSGFFRASYNTRLLRVEAEEIIHLFISDRPGQTRGVPWVHSTIGKLRQLNGYEEAEVVAARIQAAIAAFVQSPDPDNLASPHPETGERLKDLEPGVIEYLAPGETLASFIPTRPNQGFDAFVRAMLRGAAVSMGVSYEGFTGDFSNTSYSSARTALLSERDCYKVMQAWLIQNFHRPIFKEWQQLAVLSGRLNFQDFFQDRHRYCKPKFTARGWDWVDPLKETNANKVAVESGFKTLTDIAAESGRDFEELVKTRRRELDLMAAYNINFDSQPSPPEPLILDEKSWRQKNQQLAIRRQQ